MHLWVVTTVLKSVNFSSTWTFHHEFHLQWYKYLLCIIDFTEILWKHRHFPLPCNFFSWNQLRKLLKNIFSDLASIWQFFTLKAFSFLFFFFLPRHTLDSLECLADWIMALPIITKQKKYLFFKLRWKMSV